MRNAAGIGRYIEQLARSLKAKLGDQCVLWPYQTPPQKVNGPMTGVLSRFWWEQIRTPLLAHKHGAVVLHFPDFTLPLVRLRGVAYVSTIHDFAFSRCEASNNLRSRLYYSAMIAHTIRSADHIIVPSECIRLELLARYPTMSPDRCTVVWHAAEKEGRLQQAKGEGRGYLLTVGAIEPRKNLTEFAVGLRSLPQSERPIWKVVGALGRAGQKILEQCAAQLGSNFEYLGRVSDGELEVLYAECAAVAMPSYYEGFGLPALEAASRGKRVIVGRGTAMDEVLGVAATCFTLGQPQTIGMAVRDALSLRWQPQEHLSSLERRGLCSWARVADDTMKVYEKAQRQKERLG